MTESKDLCNLRTEMGEIMNKIICKPCFAFDALAAVSFRSLNDVGVRFDIAYVKEQVETHMKDIKIPADNRYFNLFTARCSFDEIEKLDLNDFIEAYSKCIEGDKLEEEFAKGLQALKHMEFTRLWDEYVLPFLQKQCDEHSLILQNEKALSIL